MMVTKAIIPAAGLGTRFLSATKAIPKEMFPIIDKPVLQLIVEEATDSGIEEIIIVTRKEKKSIEQHFQDENIKVTFVLQKEPKGLGHAVWCARKHVQNQPFAVLLGDTIFHSDKPCLKQMIDIFNEFKTSVIGVAPVPIFDISSYGIVAGEKVDDRIIDIKNMIEKPKAFETSSNLAMVGRYILTPEIFSILEKQQVGVGNEIQLTDAIETLLTLQSIFGYEISGLWYDVGNPIGYVKSIISMSLHREDLGEEIREFIKNLNL